jgi:hypothetical protein
VACMSQKALEAALGKLVCDTSFRWAFHRCPEEAVAREGFELTPVELGSLYKIELEALDAFAANIDDRVRHAAESRPRVRKRSAMK